MPKYKVATILSVAGTLLLASPLPSQSAPLMPNPLMAKSSAENANTVEVRYGWGGGWRGGWGGGWRGGWGRGWGWGAGALAGAAIAGAIAAPYYYGGGYDPYYYAPYPTYSYYAYPDYYGGYYRPYWRRPYYYRPYW